MECFFLILLQGFLGISTVLFNSYSFPKWVAYYEEIKQRLVKDSENEYGYHFSDEDFYIYLLLHGYKHFSNYGNGIGFLTDIFVFLQKKNNSWIRLMSVKNLRNWKLTSLNQ